MSRIVSPALWLLAGAVVGILVLPILPESIQVKAQSGQDWLQSGWERVSAIREGGGESSGGIPRLRESSSQSSSQSPIVARPEWCPRWADWKNAKVPRYGDVVPACLTDQGYGYLGNWKLPNCTRIRLGATGEGVVYRGGFPDTSFYTICPP